MPTYQFRCPDGSIVERVFKISEVPDRIPCPQGDGEAERIISGGAGLIFKGSGFYITDYGKDGKKDVREAAAAAEKAPTRPETGGTSGSEAAKGGGESKAEGGSGGKDKGDKGDKGPAASGGGSKSDTGGT